MNQTNLADLRNEYCKEDLSERSVCTTPLEQFSSWFDEAIASELPEPTAMILSTVSEGGIPSSRVVLLKGVEEEGFVWFTNYASDKGTHIASNPNASLLFFWPELERQIRIQGLVSKISHEESVAYFNSRPRESQLGAWASNQSSVVESRSELEQRYSDATRQYDGADVPIPPTWGGYILHPTSYEFWQGRPSRMHDRIRYRLNNSVWIIERLAP